MFDSPSFKAVYVNPETNDLYKEGDIIKLPDLEAALTAMANEGPNALYDGSLTANFIRDIEDAGGIVTAADLKSYKTKWDKPIVSKFHDKYTVYTSPLPFSGSVLVYILNILDSFLDSTPSVSNYHRITEAFKYAYGKRTQLADPVFEPPSRKVIIIIISS